MLQTAVLNMRILNPVTEDGIAHDEHKDHKSHEASNDNVSQCVHFYSI